MRDWSTSPGGVICGDFRDSLAFLPRYLVDLLFLDPLYNLSKHFNGRRFAKTSVDEYTSWFDSILTQLNPLLKPTATIYICGDWLSSCSIFEAAFKYFKIRNCITWEREKGRGAKTNWKNAGEDIWFWTVSDDYCFNVDDVKLRCRVIAPYRHEDGRPKDWN
ncbi:MAG: DNA methyltransferase [Mariprofundaceae bacterium]|nr:DNA methyltransferase [Mariprofundaceae bacterium]